MQPWRLKLESLKAMTEMKLRRRLYQSEYMLLVFPSCGIFVFVKVQKKLNLGQEGH